MRITTGDSQTIMNTWRVPTVVFLLLSCTGLAAQTADYVNYEHHPVHPLDISPSATWLAVSQTTDQRVLLFDVSTGTPRPAGHVLVGLDPVSVRFRTDEELWVVNHLSDSISIVDVPRRQVIATLMTADEPYDVVFAGTPERAFVSASQANLVQVFQPGNPAAAPISLAIDGEDPRSLAVSPDGQTVYAAIFESGNATTILAASSIHDDDPPNVTLQSDTPYGGQNPPPNDGNSFNPAIAAGLPQPPVSGLIVRKDAQGRWMDDNGSDWSRWISGANAADSGRVPGWDMPDRDIAVIDTATLNIRYLNGLMNIGMALAVQAQTGRVTLVGTDATNQIRFEPVVNGTFLRVQLAVADPQNDSSTLADLNPHLDYSTRSLPQTLRDQSIGDPRGLLWRDDQAIGYVAGMGSNSVIAVDLDGNRLPDIDPIEVGAGPIGLALHAAHDRLYVWNHFDSSLSVVDLQSHQEIDRVDVFSPLPETIATGRRHFYNTRETSGLGHVACASCHVDGRMDRLAWDLGAPDGEMKAFNQNCASSAVLFFCSSFHPMKGPMVTQTLQDIIGHEPFHWRGDRDGLEEFNAAFVALQSDDVMLSPDQMQQFEDFLDTLSLPPNPFRTLSNALSTSVSLPDVYSPGGPGLSPAGTPIASGNAAQGLTLFTSGRLALLPGIPADPVNCSGCHSLPTGMAPNARNFDTNVGTYLGGTVRPPGPNGENHLLVHGEATLNGLTMKVPQLRNLHEKTGFETKRAESRHGFGFFHDGSVDSIAHVMGLDDFDVASDQELADLTAFMLSFSGSDLPTSNPAFSAPLLDSLDSHAAVGQQVHLNTASATARLNTLMSQADAGRIELMAVSGSDQNRRQWLYQADTARFEADGPEPSASLSSVLAQASVDTPLIFTALAVGTGQRMALDRDRDGVLNRVEVAQGSHPADPDSDAFRPFAGLWYNPARNGHGIDLQQAGSSMVATWYTYNEDGTPHWYQASGPLIGSAWSGELYQTQWNPGGELIIEFVGSMSMDFSDPASAAFDWQIGSHSGAEPMIRFEFEQGLTTQNDTGLWFDASEVGWGISVDSLVSSRATLVFFYDADHQPRWVIGSGVNASTEAIAMQRATGFCPWCETTDISLFDGGSLQLDFSRVRRPQVEVAVDYAPVAGSLFERSTRLQPLSDARIDPENY